MLWILIVLIMMIAITGYLYMQTYSLKRTRHRIHFLTEANIKLVHITDIHGTVQFLQGRISTLINEMQPDLIFITGDLASNRKQLPRVLAEISRLSCPRIYFVPGNHEREEFINGSKRRLSPSQYASLNAKLRQRNVTVMENSNAAVEINKRKLLIYGFDNSIYGNERYDVKIVDADFDFKIVLAHSPRIINYLQKHNIMFNLLLVGHTHGGQIRIFNRTIGAYKHEHRGLKVIGDIGSEQYFLINQGLGTVRIPLRLNCPPEIAVID